MDISFDLTVAWAVLLVLSVFIYVVLDGFDLGVGILFSVFHERRERDVLMNSVAPVWDGNETWLILGGGGLFAAFPLAYAIIMPALYAPIIAMLLALIFRGVAFEARWRTERAKKWWDRGFIAGSVVAAFAQGVALGALLQGIEVEGRAYAGGWYDWLSWFSVITGLALVAGYGLLGATWLVMKTDGDIQEKARSLAWGFGIATVGFIVVVSAFTPFLEASYAQRWFEMPGILLAAPVPLAIAAMAVLMFRSLAIHKHEYRPFVLALLLFALCFAGLGISMYPFIIPTEVTIWDAATPWISQIFMFVGAVILIPIILAYTGYAYWVFRGKIDPEKGYH